MVRYSLKNKFSNKIEEMHHIIVNKNTQINKTMCQTLIAQLSSQECKQFFDKSKIFESNNDVDRKKINLSKYVEIDDIIRKISDCVDSEMPNTFEHNLFVIMANKLCQQKNYNNNVLNELNNNFESLLHFLTIDNTLIQFVDSKDDQFYIKLLNFLNPNDVAKVFKWMNNKNKSIIVCKSTLKHDYNTIKYMQEMINEDICDFAIALGHTNLADIDSKHHTQSICSKYIDLDINNLKHIKHTSNLPKSFFINIIENNIENVKLISDPLCFFTELNTIIVKKNGLYIKFIPIYMQTLRLLELAMKQNKLAKYYVEYLCHPNSDIEEITNLVEKSFVELKKSDQEIQNKFIDKCIDIFRSKISMKSGILFNYSDGNFDLHIMTAENYLNHQYRLYFENKYDFNIDVIDIETIQFVKTSEYDLPNINETSVSFSDKYNNKYVVVIEYIS